MATAKRGKGKKDALRLRAPRPTKAEKQKRTNQVMGLLLSGARRGEILQFSAETWGIKERESDAYIADATALIRQEAEKEREELYSEQVALRRMLRKNAMGDRDYRLALDVAKDEAKLFDLYPATKQQNLNIDLSSLNEQQLERIARGEDIATVMATSGEGRTGTAKTPDAGNRAGS